MNEKKILSIKWCYDCMANAGTACMLWMHVCLVFFFTAYLASINYLRICNTEPGFESLSLEANGSVWGTGICVSDSLPPQWVSNICKHDSLMPGKLFYTCDVMGGKKDNKLAGCQFQTPPFEVGGNNSDLEVSTNVQFQALKTPFLLSFCICFSIYCPQSLSTSWFCFFTSAAHIDVKTATLSGDQTAGTLELFVQPCQYLKQDSAVLFCFDVSYINRLQQWKKCGALPMYYSGVKSSYWSYFRDKKITVT